ncbi:MAG TPA: hypothetical protein VFW06_03845 [Acidimicrobiia bacterium]|nr:hypothetical protein [Acidimicrobiia bacterium]
MGHRIHAHRRHRVLEGLRWWGRGLIWQLPEEPYPSSYPSRLRH